MSIATTEKRRNAGGETEEHTIWFRVTAWGRQAELAAEYLAKGRQVYVNGALVSAQCAAPVTVGWLWPVVILPEEWQSWPETKLDAVLTHEREHVRRRDPLVQWLALLNRSIFWFHPLSWWLERKLSDLAEEACDAAVLRRGHNPLDYSQYLIDLARSVEQSGVRVSVYGASITCRNEVSAV
jgi:beta-lactamase regulating signal transducer with metallopeptidase domain